MSKDLLPKQVSGPVYDRIGRTYTNTRRPDPRIAAAIMRGLGGARVVVKVGAAHMSLPIALSLPLSLRGG